MINEPIAHALYWKYYKSGASIRTRQNEDGSFSIFEWSHPDGTPEPKESEIKTAISEYKTHLSNEEIAKKDRKQAYMTKIGMSKNDIQSLVDLVKDGNDE